MNWHRYFGLILDDFFSNSPYSVLLELDLSKKEQLLDVVVIRKQPGVFIGQLPDGMENLVDHNLISFKSYQETFDAWTIKELIGHYVNYRKQYSPSMKDLFPEEQFRLFGICARFPEGLAKEIALTKIQDGVYDCLWGTDTVRLLVIRDLPQNERNAMLQFFSAAKDQWEYAQSHYQQKSKETSSLIRDLWNLYSEEGLAMPYTMEDYKRELKDRLVKEFTPELKEQLLKELTVKEKLKGLSPQEIVNEIPLEEFLQSISAEEIETCLKKIKNCKENDDPK
jgi:hypothetical protein